MFFAFLFMNIMMSQGDIYVGITAYGKEQIDIIVMPFSSQAGISNIAGQCESVVASDLSYSLYFSLISQSEAGLSLSDLVPTRWSKLKTTGAEALAAATVSREGGTYTLRGILLDIHSEDVIFEKSYSGTEDQLRKIAHEFSDDIVSSLTGERGIFTTRIAYTRRGHTSSSIRICDYDGFNDAAAVGNGSINISSFWGSSGEVYFTSYINEKPEIVSLVSGSLRPLVKSGSLQVGGEFSPDGGTLAFTMNVDGNTDIYILDISSGALKRVTSSYSIECSPSWSPSGGEIAFTSDRGGGPQIYVSSADGSNARQITFTGSYNTSPAWSPRGDRILFVGMQGGLFQIFSVSPSGENQRQLTAVGDNEDPSWSPDGLHIVFSSNRSGTDKIYTMNFDGTFIREIISSPGSVMPAWSK